MYFVIVDFPLRRYSARREEQRIRLSNPHRTSLRRVCSALVLKRVDVKVGVNIELAVFAGSGNSLREWSSVTSTGVLPQATTAENYIAGIGCSWTASQCSDVTRPS